MERKEITILCKSQAKNPSPIPYHNRGKIDTERAYEKTNQVKLKQLFPQKIISLLKQVTQKLI